MVALALLTPQPVRAALLTPGDFYAPGAPASPFYDHASWDGPGQNLVEQWSGRPGLAFADGTAAPFSLSMVLGMEVRLLSETSDYASQNRFGWYVIGHPTNGELFAGSAGAGAVAFTPPITAPHLAFWWATPTGFYTSLDHPNRFALLENAGPGATSWILGLEDLTPARWDADYNDLIVQFSQAGLPPLPPEPIPEPATLGLLGVGLIGLAQRWNRRAP